MPNVKKLDQKVSEYRRTLTLAPPVAKRVDEMARAERRPIASMLRILIERGISATETPAKAA